MKASATALLIIGGVFVAMSVRAARPDLEPIFKEPEDRDKWVRGAFPEPTMRTIYVMNRAAIDTHGKPIRVSGILHHTKNPDGSYPVDFSRLSEGGIHIARQTPGIVEEIERRARPHLPATMPLFIIGEGTPNEHWHAGPWRHAHTGELKWE